MTATIITTPSATQVRSERAFDAPRDLVFQAHVVLDLVRRWLTPGSLEIGVCEIDARPGGTFRYTYHDGGEEVMSITGQYLEVDPPARIVHDESWAEGMPPIRVETDFEERGGQTVVSMLLTFVDQEARDEAIAMGMGDGVEESYANLERVIGAVA